MSNRILFFLLTGLIFGQTKTVAVFDFRNDSLSTNEVITLVERLRSEIASISDFIIVDRDRIYDILQEKKIQTNSCYGDCAIEVGKLLSAANIICGSIGRISLTYSISAILLDTKTGGITRSIRLSYDDYNDSLLSSGMRDVALEIINEEPQDTLIEAKSNMKILNNNSNIKVLAFSEPLVTLWQLDAMKNWGVERGINTENFIKECYKIPLESLTKNQGAEVLMYIQFEDIPRHW